MKDPVEFEPPRGDRVFVSPRTEESGSLATLTLLDGFPLDLCNGSVIKYVVCELQKG